jgi:regulator of sirC expression with transglutaminase-like and TPR domain
MGKQAELSSNFYDVASSRLILLRLQNNIKVRQINAEDYESALETVTTMRLFAPDDYRLLFDEAVLRVKQGEAKRAITLLQSYLLIAKRPQDIYDAEQLLRSLRDTLN